MCWACGTYNIVLIYVTFTHTCTHPHTLSHSHANLTFTIFWSNCKIEYTRSWESNGLWNLIRAKSIFLLLSQLVVISNLDPHFFKRLKYYNLGNGNYPPKWFLLFSCEKLFSVLIISFVDWLLNAALHPSFHYVIAFAWWHCILVKIYQVQFHLTEANHLKSLFLKHHNKRLFFMQLDAFFEDSTLFLGYVVS